MEFVLVQVQHSRMLNTVDHLAELGEFHLKSPAIHP